MTRSARLSALATAALLVSVPVLAPACGGGGGGGGGSSFSVRDTSYAVDPVNPLEVVGRWLLFLASETMNGAGTDLNGDGDTIDDVAVAVDIKKKNSEELIGVAAMEGVIVKSNFYLVVDEVEDGMDWSADGNDDTVLLQWASGDLAPTFVDILNDETESPYLVGIESRVYYTSADAPVGVDGTALRYIDKNNPTTPVMIPNAVGAGQLTAPQLWGSDQDLIFLSLDETEEGADFNLDTDMDDEYILALLDGTEPTATVITVPVALEDEDAPIAARKDGNANWLVGFLVDEEDQGQGSLNDQGTFSNLLLPDICVAVRDMDTDDQVLHYVAFKDFVAGMPDSLVNCGLAGEDRVIAVKDFVATLCDEDDSGCDLNGDGDTSDDVVRWCEAVTPVAPPRDPAQLIAAATGTAGGSMGLANLGNRFVMVASEADQGNIDGDNGNDFDLVGWLEPKDNPALWTFDHPGGNPGTGVGSSYAGTCWMAPGGDDGTDKIPDANNERLPIAFLEEVPDLNLNNAINQNGCQLFLKDSDEIDALPVWADFEGDILDFDGLGYAISLDNGGIVFASSHAFFRVCEADDNVDWNNDGDKLDQVLFRNPATSCNPKFMATASNIPGNVIATDNDKGASFLTSEFQDGEDINGDGDTNDIVPRYFSF